MNSPNQLRRQAAALEDLSGALSDLAAAERVRDDCVREALRAGIPITALATKLGVSRQTIYSRWVRT
jgi:DNA invertase Pin-like site-specific DNA recombinase